MNWVLSIAQFVVNIVCLRTPAQIHGCGTLAGCQATSYDMYLMWGQIDEALISGVDSAWQHWCAHCCLVTSVVYCFLLECLDCLTFKYRNFSMWCSVHTCACSKLQIKTMAAKLLEVYACDCGKLRNLSFNLTSLAKLEGKPSHCLLSSYIMCNDKATSCSIVLSLEN